MKKIVLFGMALVALSFAGCGVKEHEAVLSSVGPAAAPTPQYPEGTVPYRKVAWKDFLGTSGPFSAEIYVGYASYCWRNGDSTVGCTVGSYMSPSRSYATSGARKSTCLLRHEQDHFDMAKDHESAFRSSLIPVVEKAVSDGSDLSTVIMEYSKQYAKKDIDLFDNATNHGRKTCGWENGEWSGNWVNGEDKNSLRAQLTMKGYDIKGDTWVTIEANGKNVEIKFSVSGSTDSTGMQATFEGKGKFMKENLKITYSGGSVDCSDETETCEASGKYRICASQGCTGGTWTLTKPYKKI